MTTRHPAFAAVLAVLAVVLPSAARAEQAKLRCTADTNVSSYPSERDFNYGHSSRIRLKGIEMLGLFDFDTKPVANWRITKATLYLRHAGSERDLRTLGFSTIAAPWQEGDGSAERKPGECCFAWRALGRERWAGPYTDFTDVTFTAGHTLAAYGDIRELPDGWIAVEVEPKLVQAMLAGASYGLAVSDEKGQTHANNDVFSREQSGSGPYLVVEGAPVADAPPGPVQRPRLEPDPRHADFDHGAARLTYTPPSGAFACDITINGRPVPRAAIPSPTPGREQAVTLAGLPPGEKALRVEVVALGPTGARGAPAAATGAASAAMPKPAPLTAAAGPEAGPGADPPRTGSLRVWAYPSTEKAHPVSGNLLEEVGAAAYGGAPAGDYRRRNAVWDGRAVHLDAARSEFVAFNLSVEAAGGTAQGVRVTAPEEFRSAGGGAGWRPRVEALRDWYVKDGDWYPEVCVPLAANTGGAFDIPAADNGVPGQRNQSLFIELLVPRDAPPGDYRGEVTVAAPGAAPLRIPVMLRINSLTLPDTLGFDISLNTYGTLGGPFGIDDRTAEYRALERAYHRFAHLHRATLAPLGYSHSGTISTNYAPPVAGEGAAAHVTDWSAWDAQFGPYLDGSAFADLPRAGVPISHLYLPFHEAWPADINRYYHYQQTTNAYPEMITEHALKALPIEQAMDPALGQAFEAVVRQFAEHFRAKGWTKTHFQYYENDKHYYKDPKQGGRGTSWWLLDEPNHRDDWLALAYFARLFRAGMQGFPDVPMIIREDISRPQWQRDYLDGLVDLMVVSNELYDYGPRLREMQEEWPVRFWNYGSANPVHETNLTEEAWAARAWLAGADGIVPWQTVGSDENFTKPDETALLLPGKRFGIMGPVASLRLKALRRAEQDAEYLLLLAKAKGWNRDQVAAAVGGLVKLDAAFDQREAEDAGRYRFGKLRARDFAALRRAIAEACAAR